MAQDITWLGATYEDIPGLTLPKTGGGTALFADPSGVTAAAADVASGKYFLDSSGNLVAGTASGGGGDNDVVVTLTLNSQSDTWEPDRTYAELYAAYQAEKTIAWVTADGEQSARGYYNSYVNGFEYYVEEYFDDSTGEGYVSHGALLDSNGVTDYGRDDPAYYTYYATAVPSDVANGKVFFNADGMQTGTASGGSGSSAWTKVAETSYQISETNTGGVIVGTWSTGDSSIWTDEKFLYVRVRDTAGARPGYFYGSDQFFLLAPNDINSASSSNFSGRFVIRCDENGSLKVYSNYNQNGYGVYATIRYNTGGIQIRARYSATYSYTVDGTYKVEAYLLDPAGGIPIFG